MDHDLHNNLLKSGFSQHVNKPMRSDNILDLIFSINDGLVSNVNTGPEFGTNDHIIVSFNINLKVYKGNVSEELAFIYQTDNFEKVWKILADTYCGVVETETDVGKSWAKFYNILNGTVKICIPVRRRCPRNNSQIAAGLLYKKHAHNKYLPS